MENAKQSGRVRRAFIDTAMRRFFRLTAWFSVVALASMLLFVFIQGVEPFLEPSADSIQVVFRNIPNIKINGIEYDQSRRDYIPIGHDAEEIHLEFTNRGEPVNIRIPVNIDSEELDGVLQFPDGLQENLGSTEANAYSLTWPGRLAGMDQSIFITIPEPRQSVFSFLFGMDWRPVHKKLYGIFPMIAATFLTTLGAALLGVPIALLAAVLISEFMSKRVAALIQSAVDLLAGIPSVVYGFFGLMIIVPFIQKVFSSPSGSSLAAAIVVLAIMILPTVIAISLTSLKAVPRDYREASLAVGATKMQTAWRVVFPAASSGIFASIILGVSRAVGETMAIIMVAGNSPQMPTALTDSVRSLTGTIALEMGYAAPRHNHMLFGIGIVLFIVIFGLNAVFMRLKKRMEEEMS